MNVSKEKKTNSTQAVVMDDFTVHNISSSVFIFGEVQHKNKTVMNMVSIAQDIKYDSYVLIGDCYILQEKSSNFVCICKKCEQNKANTMLIIGEGENPAEFVQIVSCCQDNKSLEEQGNLLIAKYKPLIDMKV